MNTSKLLLLLLLASMLTTLTSGATIELTGRAGNPQIATSDGDVLARFGFKSDSLFDDFETTCVELTLLGHTSGGGLIPEELHKEVFKLEKKDVTKGFFNEGWITKGFVDRRFVGHAEETSGHSLSAREIECVPDLASWGLLECLGIAGFLIARIFLRSN